MSAPAKEQRPEQEGIDRLVRDIEDGIYEYVSDDPPYGFELDYEEEEGPLVLRRKSDGKRFEIDARVRVNLASPVEKHKPTGTMGWPNPYPQGHEGAHAGIHVCGNAQCQAEASEWVRSITGHDGVFRSFEDARREAERTGGQS